MKPDDLDQAMSTVFPSQGQDYIGEKPPKKRRKRVVNKAAKKPGRPAGAKVAKAKRAPRGAGVTMDLAGTMDLLGSMHRTDVPVFQVISEALSSRAKPSRRRLLAAIVKVFG